MYRKLRGWLGFAGCAVLAGGGWSAEQPSGPEPKPPPAKQPSGKQPGDAKQPKSETAKQPKAVELPRTVARPLDAMTLPTGSVFVILDDAKNALGLVKGVWLTPEKYQELVDQIETLKRQLKPDKPRAPTKCKLTGRVDGDVVHFTVEFEIRTERPREQVALGCQRAWPRSAKLDGQLPLLSLTEEGLVVQIDAPGVHHLTLDLELLVVAKGTKGSERGFDLGLPRTAITSLEQFTLPVGVTEVRVNGRAVRTRSGGRLDSPILGSGPVEHLELSWRGPVPAEFKGAPLLVAENGKLIVRLEETRVTTDVELQLQVVRGETAEWRVYVPAAVVVDLKEPGPQDERLASIKLPTAKEPWIALRLKEASAEPLRVVFQATQTRKGALVPLGPYTVLGSFRQRGTILISAPPEFRLRYHPRGDISQREVIDDMRWDNAVAAFSYWNLPAPANPTQPLPSTLDLEVETVKGAVETRVEHTLLVSDSGYQLATKIEATPIRTGVERLDVQLPADYVYDRDKGATPAELVDDVVIDPPLQGGRGGVAHIKLAQKQFRPFAVTLPALQGFAVGNPAGPQKMSLELPRPLQTLDRGAQLTVALPEGRELVAQESVVEALPPGTRKYTWRWERAPATVALAWRDYRPELPVDSVIDVTLTAHQARVEQQLQFHFPDPPPTHVQLQIPAPLADHVRVLQGGTLGANGFVRLDRADNRVSLRLGYAFSLPDPTPSLPSEAGAKGGRTPPSEGASKGSRSGRRFAVPFVRAAQATRCESKVRVWSDPGRQVGLAEGLWDEQPTEAVSDKDSLPALVLRSGSLECPLALRQSEAPLAPLAPIVIDRALIQVVVADGGHQNYRARFLISRLSTRHLDLELPALLASLNLEVLLDGKKVPRQPLIDSSGSENVIRLDLEPDLYHKPVVLDLRYQIAPGRTRGNSSLQSTFYPPVPRDDVFLGRVRWQVGVPATWISLYQGGGSGAEQRWEWRGGLLTPRTAVTSADLERWLGGPADDSAEARLPEDAESGLVCWRTELESLPLLHVPQTAWLLACSLTFLVVGLGLSFANMSRGLFWTAVAALALALAYAGICWPSILTVMIYGCEPGAMILLLILVVQWMLHQHYRRQVVFLPGFSRVKAGSSLVRTGIRPRGEPSTIDAPLKRESSLK